MTLDVLGGALRQRVATALAMPLGAVRSPGDARHIVLHSSERDVSRLVAQLDAAAHTLGPEVRLALRLDAQLDPQGHSYVMLGATGSEGIPMDLFTSGELRWCRGIAGRTNGRGTICEYTYALQAANALTLCGLPASALPKATTSSVVLNSLCSETGRQLKFLVRVPLSKLGGSPSEQRYHRT